MAKSLKVGLGVFAAISVAAIALYSTVNKLEDLTFKIINIKVGAGKGLKKLRSFVLTASITNPNKTAVVVKTINASIFYENQRLNTINVTDEVTIKGNSDTIIDNIEFSISWVDLFAAVISNLGKTLPKNIMLNMRGSLIADGIKLPINKNIKLTL